VYGGFPVMAADFQSGNGNFGGSFTSWQRAQAFQQESDHGPTETVWDDHYDTILRANTILARVGEVPDIESEVASRIRNEARFIRALAYFNLVRWFAQPYEPGANNTQPGVVVTTDPLETFGQASDSTFTDQPRATVEAVYDLILSDLQSAVDSLGAVDNRKRASATAARALRSKVYLNQGRYAEAAEDAEAVINTSGVALVDDPTTPYVVETVPEIIFSVAFNETDNTGVNDFPSSFYLPSDLGGRGDITVTSELFGAYESGDLRGFGGESQPDGNFLVYSFGGSPWTNKWTEASLGDDAIVFRAGEIYLIAAEAIARSNYSSRAADAQAYLNAVRSRSEASTINASSQQELVNAIVNERRLELAFEGKWRHTLVRLGLPMGPTTEGDPKRILPIPQREVDINEAISESDQNPGY
jgi:hypothetical protein